MRHQLIITYDDKIFTTYLRLGRLNFYNHFCDFSLFFCGSPSTSPTLRHHVVYLAACVVTCRTHDRALLGPRMQLGPCVRRAGRRKKVGGLDKPQHDRDIASLFFPFHAICMASATPQLLSAVVPHVQRSSSNFPAAEPN